MTSEASPFWRTCPGAHFLRRPYRIAPQTLLVRRAGRKQWRYSLTCKELECQLKARQAYEQQSGDATATQGKCFWELRSIKG